MRSTTARVVALARGWVSLADGHLGSEKMFAGVGEKTLADLIEFVHFVLFHRCCHRVQR